MAQFRKKPVVIEAWQVTKARVQHPPWLTAALNAGSVWMQGGPDPYYTIKTLEGEMRANVGDWIIKRVKGEFYPCKPDIFVETYEPASERKPTADIDPTAGADPNFNWGGDP